MCLSFQKNSQSLLLSAYADADWTGDEDRKSTTGFLIEIYGNPVCWVTKKQSTVVLSSTEAECVVLAMALAEVVLLRSFLEKVEWKIKKTITIFEDNQSCIHLLSKWEHQQLKHIDVKFNFIRDLQTNGVINVTYVPSEQQKADVLTKSITFVKFKKLRNSLNLKCI